MAQPKHLHSYGTDMIKMLMQASLGREISLTFCPQPGEDADAARRRAFAFVHRMNGLKRAMRNDGHAAAELCSAIRVRTPQPGAQGWRVELVSPSEDMRGVVVVGMDGDDALRAEDTGAGATSPTETPELDFDALLDEEL